MSTRQELFSPEALFPFYLKAPDTTQDSDAAAVCSRTEILPSHTPMRLVRSSKQTTGTLKLFSGSAGIPRQDSPAANRGAQSPPRRRHGGEEGGRVSFDSILKFPPSHTHTHTHPSPGPGEGTRPRQGAGSRPAPTSVRAGRQRDLPTPPRPRALRTQRLGHHARAPASGPPEPRRSGAPPARAPPCPRAPRGRSARARAAPSNRPRPAPR